MTPLARCPSCARMLSTDEGCAHEDCGWRPPFSYGVVTPEEGLAWIERTRQRLQDVIARKPTPRPDSEAA